QVGSPKERQEVIEGAPCIILATSGMLVGGASVEYLKNFSNNPHNGLILTCYQPPGSLGRDIKEGAKELKFDGESKPIEFKMTLTALDSLTAHAGRNELLNFVNNIVPNPRKIIINHGEVSKSLDLASSLYKLHKIETSVPRALDAVRLK
ncbi:MAG: MBL fold metallo-hydrolase RNA specificity domain-containing protein, partial [archaeon]